MPDPISGSTSQAALLAQLNAQTQSTAGLPGGQNTSSQNLDATTNMGKDTFLKLLVAQLKYQNPMSPTDGTQFLAQSAQFTMVEKLESMETQMTSLVNMQQRMEASSLVGKDVTYLDQSTDKTVDGIVSSVDFSGDTPTVKVNGQVLAMTDINGVKSADTTAPAPAATPPTDSTGSGTPTNGTTGTTQTGTTQTGTGTTGTTPTTPTGTGS
jgi:flagellar basal-body rod modification protein FlgD